MNRKMRTCLFTVTFLLLVVFAACNKNNHTEDELNKQDNQSSDQVEKETKENRTILSIGDIKVNQSEVMTYILYLKNMYEPTFTSEIWNYQLESGQSFAQMAKEEVLNQIIEVKVMKKRAKELNIELTEDEIMESEKKAEDFFSLISEQQRLDYNVTYETILEVCKDNYLAEKVFDVVTMTVDSNISDEEAKQTKIWQIYVATNAVDESGKAIALSKEEKQGAYNKAKKIAKAARKTDDFYDFAIDNSDDSQIEFTVGRGDRDDAFIDKVFALKKGEISSIIETDNGYYILYCVSPFDEDATAQKKEEIISNRQDEEFRRLYSTWLKEYKIKINQDNLQQIMIVE